MKFSHELIIPEEGFPFKLFLFEGNLGNYRREKHWHRSVEIFAVRKGELNFYIDFRKWKMKAGEFLIVNSNEVHSIDAFLPNETIVLQIPLKMFQNYYMEQEFIWFTHDTRENDDHMMRMLGEMYDCYSHRRCGYEMKVMSLFYEILYYLVSTYRLTEKNERKIKQNRKMERLSSVTSYMKENYSHSLSLQEVAETFDYSPNYLSRMFQKYAGITFKQYLQSIRLEYAIQDIQKGGFSLTEIALRNGFSGSKGLARAFQGKYGMLPSQFRKNIHQEDGKKDKKWALRG